MLTIVNAKYGIEGKFVDVTNIASKKVKNDRLCLSVSNDSFKGDPAPLTRKKLILEYELDGKSEKVTLPEGVIVEIPEIQKKPLKKNRLSLNLPEVTLATCCWGNNSFLSSLVWAYKQFGHKVHFAEKLFFISEDIDHINYGDFFVNENIQVIPVSKGYSIGNYSKLVVKELNDFIDTDFVMLFQNDGFIDNINKWDERFLDYDYIGAPWWYKDEKNVGNGGFSVRSKKLLKVLAQDESIKKYHPEDHNICRVYGKHLKDNHGIKFAPDGVASRFSVETGRYTDQFGFHCGHQLEAYLKRTSS
jgi:hypothetical protein